MPPQLSLFGPRDPLAAVYADAAALAARLPPEVQSYLRARAEAERMRARATEDLEQQMARRERQALDKIAQAEATALAEVRDMTVDVAIAATRTILAKDLNGAAAGKLVDDAIGDLASKLH
jgi:F-type H+-transporting ATPase subunit b